MYQNAINLKKKLYRVKTNWKLESSNNGLPFKVGMDLYGHSIKSRYNFKHNCIELLTVLNF